MEAAARLSLIRRTLLQFLIGNSDAHGKNISFFVKPRGIKVVRAYDWAEFAVHCRVGRQLLAREMVRMAKHAYKALPGLLAWPEYTEEERVVVAKIGALVTRQAQRLESAAVEVPRIGMEDIDDDGKKGPKGKMIKSS